MALSDLIKPGALFINEDNNIFLCHDELRGYYILRGGKYVNTYPKPTDILHPGFLLDSKEVRFKYVGNIGVVLREISKHYSEKG